MKFGLTQISGFIAGLFDGKRPVIRTPHLMLGQIVLRLCQPKLMAFVFGLVFAGWSNAATQQPTIEPSQVNAKDIGLCEIYNPNDLYSPGSALNPVGGIYLYVASHQKSHLTELELTDFSVKYLKQPLHGIIKAVSNKKGTLEFYIPNAGYAGNDRYVAEVAVKGVKFRVAGYIRPSSDVMSPFAVCRRTGLSGAAWKIQ